jgi:hypothetical protein
VAAGATDDAAARVNRAVLDLRLSLLDAGLRGERRQLVEDELQALRLARVGIATPSTVGYLRKLGITRDRRPPLMTRGPETFGSAVRAYVALR